jgi:hypothetical protein
MVLLINLFLGTVTAEPFYQEPPIHITFDSDQPGQFPSGWISRNGKEMLQIYSVQIEGGKKYLHADARNIAAQIGYEKKWVLKDFPVLNWQWRAIHFPDNTNEHNKNSNDSVLGIYVVFGRWAFIKTIKYIWSDTLPAGTILTSPTHSRTKIVVIQSGRMLKDQWVTEKRNVLADYRLLFGDGDQDETPTARGIAILTDSDNSHTHAIGDYADTWASQAEEKHPATIPSKPSPPD